MEGLFPNPRFARVAYQLSAALWRACRDRSEQTFASVKDLESWDACFGAAYSRRPLCGASSVASGSTRPTYCRAELQTDLNAAWRAGRRLAAVSGRARRAVPTAQ
jgi:hypothetical protein